MPEMIVSKIIMKYLFFSLFSLTLPTLTLSAFSLGSNLLITAVFDGPLSGSSPKGVELYATADIADLSLYAIGSANNGGGSDGAEYTLSGTATAGQYIYIKGYIGDSSVDRFAEFFGFEADFTTRAMTINGDDSIELYYSNSVFEVIDTFGNPNVDGDGEDWEYRGGWAYRNSSTKAGTFTSSDWTFSGSHVWDGATTNASSDAVMPIGTYTVNSVPEPSTYALLLGIYILGYAFLRRRK